MAAKKTIVVVGATGRQGGSVADVFLGLENWKVRAMTRNSSSKAAQALKAKGAELVHGDLVNLSSLKAAFAGAHAIFLNTDFWTIFYPAKAALEAEGKDVAGASQIAFDQETLGGKNAAIAAAGVPTLERIVCSALPSLSKGGKQTRSLHPEAKNWIVEYIEGEQPELAKKLSVIYLGAYNSNLLLYPTLVKASGQYKLRSPIYKHIRLPIIDPGNTGLFVRELIETEKAGVKLFAYDSDSDLDMGQIVEAWSRASGKQAEYVPVTTQQMRDMGALWEHLDAVDGINASTYDQLVPGIIRPHQLQKDVKTKSWEQWLKEQPSLTSEI